ncbi:MAG: hypothetical protein O2894_11980, partial [Planctomycetota bacterium]|nr:hypothetical protein [Planctomycetota bacterium]
MRAPLAFLVSLLALAAAVCADDGHGPALENATPLEAQGRDVFRREACWLCHGQGARGASLALEASARSSDWLLAHLIDPRLVSPGSPMPASPQLFEPPEVAHRIAVDVAIQRLDSDGNGRVSFVQDATPAWAEDAGFLAAAAALDRAGLEAPETLQTPAGEERRPDAQGRRAYEDRWQPGVTQGDGVLSARDARPAPTADACALVAYVRAQQSRSDGAREAAVG